MATYFLFGEYSQEALKGISSKRTEEAETLIQSLGGKVKGIYALLGVYDIVVIAEFPETEKAMKASVSLTKMTGISFTTSPAVSVERFDEIMEK